MVDVDFVARNEFSDLFGTPAVGPQAFSIQVRPTVTTIPVPSLRPTAVTTNLAFDLMPNGAPGNDASHAPLSVCWFDVCNADLISTPSVACNTTRVGCGTAISEIGTYNFNGASQLPLVFTLNGTTHLQLQTTGNIDGTNPVNTLSYFHQNNSSTGTSAYVEVGAENDATNVAYARMYGANFNFDTSSDAGWAEFGSLGTGVNITASAATGSIRFITGGYTPSVNLAAEINAVGAANAPGSLSLSYPPILPIYTIGTLPTGTAALTGARAFVSNGLLATGWGVAVAGTGSVMLPVFCIGTGGWHYG